MKALLFSFLFLFSINLLNSQIPFAPVGAKHYIKTECPPSYSPSFSFIAVSADTVLQGKYCTEINQNAFFYNCSFSRLVHSDSQKVFVYDDVNEEFNLVYDFSKQEGESYRIKLCYDLFEADSATVNILIAENINYGTIPAVKQRLEIVSDNDSTGWFSSIEYEIYEGIGGRWGNILLFHPTFGTTSHCSIETLCYWSEYTGSVGIVWSHIPCIPNNTDEEYSNNYFSISPNPSYASAQLKYDLPRHFKNAEILIFDSTGQLQYSFPIKDHVGKTTINNLPTGIYFIIMSSDGRPISSEKLIVLK